MASRQKPARANQEPAGGRLRIRLCLLEGLLKALLMVLLLPASLPAQQPENGGDAAQDQPPAAANAESSFVTVHGTVYGASGEPLARALVRIEGEAETGALTDGEGHFEIPAVPAGPQIFQVRKPGFFDHPSSLPAELLEDPSNLSHNIMVTAGMRDISFTMAPYCAIHGQIDLSSGDPAEGITVQLLRRILEDGRGTWQMAASARTNRDGAYRFGNLQDGVYMLRTQPAFDSEPVTNVVAPGSATAVQRSGYASVFYPDSRDMAGATRLHLTNGDQAQANFTLTLEPFYSVTANVAMPRLGASQSAGPVQFAASLLAAGGLPFPYAVEFDQQTGALQTAVPSGSYTLLVSGAPNLQRQFARSADGALDPETIPTVYNGAVDFSVAGHPIAGLRVPPGTAPTNTVNLTVLRSAGATSNTGERGSITVLATPAGDAIGRFSFFAVEMAPGPNPAFTLPPGSYWLRSDASGQDLCEQSLSAAGINLAREPLTVSASGAASPVDLVLRDNCARLTLSLPNALTGFLPGEEPSYTVVVVPDFDSTRQVEPLTLRPSSGSPTLQRLAPGSYHVYTLDGPVRVEYRNPAALAALPNRGQQVVLSEGATASLVLEVPQK